jgi:hypothetical protein
MAFFITEATNNKKNDVSGKHRKPRNEDLVDKNDYMPKRFGLKYDPPTIVLEYMVMSIGKLYHHKMKITKLKPDSDINEMIDYLYSRHSFYLKEDTVGRQQLANLIVRLQKRMELKSGSRPVQKKAPSPMWKAPEPVKKALVPMKKAPVVNKKPAAEAIPNSYLPSMGKQKPKATDEWGGDDEWGDDWGESNNKELDYNLDDLNKLTTEELKKEKAKMDVQFEKNRKLPDDKGFEYDVRKEFVAKEA